MKQHIRENDAQADATTRRNDICYAQTASLFSDNTDMYFWRPVAVSAWLLPPNSFREDISSVDICRLNGPDIPHNRWLSAPYTITADGRTFVKGSRHRCIFREDGKGGPHTKYEALFDPRPEFDGLRCSLLRDMFHRAPHAIRDVPDMDVDRYNAILRFVLDFADCFTQRGNTDEMLVNFASRAWPLLRHCLVSKRSFYLSCDSLMLVREACGHHAAIFRSAGNCHHFEASSIHGEDSASRCIVLQDGHGVSRVRSHSQRSIPAEHFGRLKTRWSKVDAEARARKQDEQKRRKEAIEQAKLREAQERANTAAAEQE